MGKDPVHIVEQFYVAMRGGASHVEELIALFADDATYTDPFSPAGPTTHRGREDIAAYLRAGMQNRPADFALVLDALEVQADAVVARWTCSAEAFGGDIRGEDRFVIVAGSISTLTTRLVTEAR